MIDVYVFAPDLAHLGIVEALTGYKADTCYYEAGGMELTCQSTARNRRILRPGNILGLRKDRAAAWLREHGRPRAVSLPGAAPYGRIADAFDGWIITRVTLTQDDEGERVAVVGSALSSLLGRRVVDESLDYSGATPDDIIRDLVDRHLIDPTDPGRAIPRVEQLPGVVPREAMDRNVSHTQLYEAVAALAKEADIGFDLVLLARKRRMGFVIYTGRDRTGGDVFAGRAVFDERRLASLDWETDIGSARSDALVAGAGEGTARRCLWVGDDAEGLDRWELVVEADDISDEETVTDGSGQTYKVRLPDVRYQPLLRERGREKLCEYFATEQVTGSVSDNCDLWWGVDYLLGDLVQVRHRAWGLVTTRRITQVRESCGADGYIVTPVFGDQTQNPIDRVINKLT